MTNRTGPTDSLQTREKILEVAARLFSAQGYENTALSQVAREAQVSKALIFWHFDSKEKLLRAALRRTLEPFFVNTGDFENPDERTQIEQLIDEFYEFVRKNVYSVRFLLRLILRGEKESETVIERVNEPYCVFRGLLAEAIERGRKNKRFRQDVQPELDASLILATLDGILIEHFLNEDLPYDPTDLVDHLKQTIVGRLLA